jgi:hypothetical protein
MEIISDEENTIELPRILFLNYSIVNNNLIDEYKITLINKIISEGQIKETTTEFQKPKIDDLEYIVLDKKSQAIKRGFLANPLNKTIEYVTEDGKLAKKDIRLDSALFALRIQLKPIAESVVLERFTGLNSENIHLLTTKIHLMVR